MAQDVSPEGRGPATLEPFEGFADAAKAVVGVLSSEQPAELERLVGRLLGTILATELALEAERRRAERAEAATLLDRLTRVANRSAWLQRLGEEEDRCRRYATSAGVIVVDVEHLHRINSEQGNHVGDELLKRMARVLVTSVRAHDFVARTGGDEFAVLVVNCSRSETEAFSARIGERLREADIPASVGSAIREVNGDLHRAWREADNAMYEAKRQAAREGERQT